MADLQEQVELARSADELAQRYHVAAEATVDDLYKQMQVPAAWETGGKADELLSQLGPARELARQRRKAAKAAIMRLKDLELHAAADTERSPTDQDKVCRQDVQEPVRSMRQVTMVELNQEIELVRSDDKLAQQTLAAAEAAVDDLYKQMQVPAEWKTGGKADELLSQLKAAHALARQRRQEAKAATMSLKDLKQQAAADTERSPDDEDQASRQVVQKPARSVMEALGWGPSGGWVKMKAT